MTLSISFRSMGVLFYLVTLVGVSAQTTVSPQPTQPAPQTSPVSSTGSVTISTSPTPVSQQQAMLQVYVQEQDALAKERQALIAQGATPEQLAAWRQQNATQLESQKQRVEAMAAASALQQMPTNRQPNIPPNASPTLADFMTEQTALANARAQMHNQIVQQITASGQSVTSAQISQMEQQAMQSFQQQHAAELQIQAQREQTLASASVQAPLQTPPPLHLPPNASPQLQAFLTTRNQLMRERIQLLNQYANADPSVRQAALQQWRHQNAGLIQQGQQQAQNLSQAATTTPN
jgi:hypothetical protein